MRSGALLLVSVLAFPPTSGPGKWQQSGDVYRHRKLAGPITTVWVDADVVTPANPDGKERSLSFECHEDRVLFVRLFRGELRLSEHEPNLQEFVAQLSFDGGPSTRYPLARVDSIFGRKSVGGWVEFQEPARLIQEMKQHQRLTISLNERDRSGKTSLEFDIRGFTSAFRPLAGCRVPKGEMR